VDDASESTICVRLLPDQLCLPLLKTVRSYLLQNKSKIAASDLPFLSAEKPCSFDFERLVLAKVQEILRLYSQRWHRTSLEKDIEKQNGITQYDH
jgi:hypothetical protein